MSTEELIQRVEKWNPVIGYEERYLVSNIGRVYSIRNKKIKSLSDDSHGYQKTMLYKNYAFRCIKIHRLVAEAFIPNPNNKRCVNHINGIKSDNRVENLEWATHSENQQHSVDSKLRVYEAGKLVNNETTSKRVSQFSIDGSFIKAWPSIKEAQRHLGISNSCISHCINGRNKTAGGYIWKAA